MYNQQTKQKLIEIMKELKKEGYKCYTVKDSDYGFIVTPSDNVLYIQKKDFVGWNFTLEYVPSRQCGSGCQCLIDPVENVTVDIVKQAEKEGLQFAKKLGAKLFTNSNEWFKQYWDKDNLEEV